MRFLFPILTAATFVAAMDVALPPSRSAGEASRTAVPEVRGRLAWFNSLDRSFSLNTSGSMVVSLHATNGAQIAVLRRGVVAEREILRVTEDLPPGVYLLCVRQDGRQTLERVTLF